MDKTALIVQLFILVGSATLIATIFYYLRLPTIVGFITAGMLLGPYGLALVQSVPGAELLTEIAIVFLMFTLGLEFSSSKLKQFKRPFFLLGATQVVGTVVITALIMRFFVSLSWPKAVLFAYMISASSTAIVLKLLSDSRQTETPYGTNSIAILLFQDLAVIPMMLSLPLLSAGQNLPNLDMETVVTWTGKLSFLIVALAAVGRYIVPFAIEKVVRTRSRELFFFAILLLVFGVAFLTSESGLSVSFGAFLAGLMLAESPYGRQATADFTPLRDNFLGLFFTSVGMLVDTAFAIKNIHWVVVIVVSILIIKSGIVFIFARLTRYQAAVAAMTALLVFQIGEFSFVLASTGIKMQILDAREIQFFLTTSVITMMITPFVLNIAPRLVFSSGFQSFANWDIANVPRGMWRVLRKTSGEQKTMFSGMKSLKKEEVSNHTIIVGYGIAGRNMAAALKSLQLPHVVIEQSMSAINELKQSADNKFFFGDASREEILEAAGIERAKLVAIVVSGRHITSAVVRAVRAIRPDIHLLIRVQYARDAEEIGALENANIIVAEYETTVELLGRALASYGVLSTDIQEFMMKTRSRMQGQQMGLSDALRHRMDLPMWDALNALQPIVVKDGFFCIGKSLIDLDIRAKTGASVVAVFRDGVGSLIPDAQFVLQKGDVLHLIAPSESMTAAKALLQQG